MKTLKSLLTFVLSPDNVKRIGPESVKEVEKLVMHSTNYLFGETPAEVHLLRNYLSLGIYSDENELAAAISLNCYPNVPSLPPWEWDHWLSTLYKIDGLLSLNTLWIHFAVWDRRYTTIFIKAIFQHVFQCFEPVENILMVCPPGISRLDFIDEFAKRVLPYGFINPSKVQTIYLARKENFVAHYVIRRAVEEDNDDLVSIIPDVVEKTYGSYYISELLSNEEETGRQLIVAEHRGAAVGVLCLNETVNYEILNEEFELVPYNGLKKHDVADEVIQEQASNTLIATADDAEHLSNLDVAETEKEVCQQPNAEDENSEDDYSLVDLSSSLIFFLYQAEEVGDGPAYDSDSDTSIESHFSAVVLNEDYEDHLYNAEKRDMIDGDEKKLKRRESRLENTVIPTFHGEPNAFAMEICAALPEHESCLYLLFQAAFQCFPNRDYIVVSFPANSTNTYLTKHFVRVVPRPNSVFNHELYVLHKSTILGMLSVRASVPQDKPRISELVSSLTRGTVIEDAFREAVDVPDSPMWAYTFVCDKQIIGCAIVFEELDYDYLSFHYSIDDWIKNGSSNFGTVGGLEHFIISPIFQRHLLFFTRELHRLSNFHILFYRLKRYDYMYNHRNLPIVNAIINMVPIVPKRPPQYSEQVKNEYQLPEYLHKYHQPFGLYLSSLRSASMQKIEVNQRIVVIGAGATTLAFLESLIFGQNLNYLVIFTNVTVVSPHGIGYHKQPSPVREMIFVNDGHLDRKYTDAICLKTYVHVVTGVMTSINRKEKYVSLYDDTFIPYDYLFLLCGEQFQKPPLKKKDVVKKRTEFPQNVFIINTEIDAGNALNALKNLTAKKQSTVVVFGHYLEACCCLAALMEFGVSGNNLVYIDPTADSNPKNDHHEHLTQFFNNIEIETAVFNMIQAEGVTIYQDYNFVDWHFDASKNYITSAKFESKYKFVEIELSSLFIYHSKAVSARTFQAIAKSGLVFNGRLVIDTNYQTNDPYIYGAGSLTMYSKRHYAEHLIHKYYDSREIGTMLGRHIRKKLIPSEYSDPPFKETNLRRPVVRFCRFPGKMYYLQVVKAGPPVPVDVAMNKSNYGRVLETGDCKKLDKQGYFRLHLNRFQVVETITCLAKFPLHVHNLISLWGKHEVLLNHLLLRFDNDMITDLFDYFDQPWAFAIYHRHFHSVLDDINTILYAAETTEGVKLIDEINSRLEQNNWHPLNKMQMDEIEEMCRDMKIIPQIENKVLDFLHEKYVYLPMYAHQLIVRWVVHQSKMSPLFVKTLLVLQNELPKEIDPTKCILPKTKSS